MIPSSTQFIINFMTRISALFCDCTFSGVRKRCQEIALEKISFNWWQTCTSWFFCCYYLLFKLSTEPERYLNRKRKWVNRASCVLEGFFSTQTWTGTVEEGWYVIPQLRYAYYGNIYILYKCFDVECWSSLSRSISEIRVNIMKKIRPWMHEDFKHLRPGQLL